jgi:hypothetical protein
VNEVDPVGEDPMGFGDGIAVGWRCRKRWRGVKGMSTPLQRSFGYTNSREAAVRAAFELGRLQMA